LSPRARLPAWPLTWATLWLVASSLYLAVRYEPFSPDSYVYVAAAQQALETGSFSLPFAPTTAMSVPVPLSAWPPGYPALVALATKAGLDPWVAATCVSAISMVLLFVAAAVWLARRPGGWAGLGLAGACSMTAVVSVTAWSEGPFVLALAGAIASLAWLCEPDHRLSWPAALFFCGALATALLIRHACWFVLPAFAWHIQRRRSTTRPLAAGSIALACVPAAAWLWRHSPMGLDAMAALEPWRMIRSSGQTAAALGKLVMAPWLGPEPWLAFPGVLVICGLGVLQWRTRETQSSFSRLLWLSGWSLLAGTWIVGLANPASFFATDRLLWPGWVFLALAVGTSLRPGHAHGYRVALVFLLLSHSAGVIRLPLLEPRPPLPKQDFHATRQLLSDQLVVSNEAWRAWHLWGVSGYYLPRAHQGGRVLSPDTLARWAALRNVNFLLWFEDGLTQAESVLRYGPVAEAGHGVAPDVLELVAEDSICHTYRIRSAGAP